MKTNVYKEVAASELAREKVRLLQKPANQFYLPTSDDEFAHI